MTTKLYKQPTTSTSTTPSNLNLTKLDPVSLVKDKTKNLREVIGYPNTFTIDKSDDFDKYKDGEVFTVVDLSFHLKLKDDKLSDGTIRSNGPSGGTLHTNYYPRFQWVLYPKISDNHNFVLPFTELTSYGLDEINGVLRVNLDTLEASLDGRYFHYDSNYDYSYNTLIYTFYQENWFSDHSVELPLTATSNDHLTITLSDVKIDVKRVPTRYLLSEKE